MNQELTAKMRRSYGWVLLGFCLLLRLVVASRPVPALDGVSIPDDSYYSLHLARSIAQGQGPLYGPVHTNGFQPLFVFLMVPFFWLLSDPLALVRAALVLCALADTLALYFLSRILRDQETDDRAVAVVMLLWSVSPYCLSNGVNGLETSLAVCCLLLAVWRFPRVLLPESGPRAFFAFGLCAGLALFARVDTGILLPIAALLALRALRPRGGKTLAGLGLAAAAGVVLVNLPWWLYSYHYTGRIYPVSGRAVRYLSLVDIHHRPTLKGWYLPELILGVKEVVTNNLPTLVLLLVALVGIAIGGGRRGLVAYGRAVLARPLLPLYCVVLFFAYTLYIFTEWFFFRYFYPVNAALLLLLALALSRWLALLSVASAWRAATAFALVALLANVGRAPFRQLFFGNQSRDLAALNVGRWAHENIPPGTIVGSPSSGAVGYFAPRLTVVNLDGVVNHEAYEAMQRGELFQYAQGKGVDHLLIYSKTLDLLRLESRPWAENELLDMGELPGFRTYRKPWHLYRVRR